MIRKIRLLPIAWLFLLLAAACSKEDEAIDPNAPRACFSTAESNVYAGVGVGFTSECSFKAKTYLWSFGDGGVSLEANPVHVFKAEGTYAVSLTIEDELGTSHTTGASIVVKPSPFIEHSGYIDEAEVWEEGMHLVKGNVYIRHGSLTIKPGAQVYINKQKSIFVGHAETASPGGALFTANGTADKPIIFKPSSGLQLPGEWGHLFFTEKASAASSIQHADIQYGGKANATWDYEASTYYTHYGMLHINKTGVRIENTKIRGAANYGISLKDQSFFTSFANNTLTDNASYPITVHFNYVHTIGTGNVLQSDRGILVYGEYYAQPDATWKKQSVPYVLQGIKRFSSSTTVPYQLRIEAGTTIALMKGVSLGGLIIAEGTAANPIVFTSAEANKAKGDWASLTFSSGSIVSHCRFEYGGAGDSYNAKNAVYLGVNTSFTHSTITESGGSGITYREYEEATVFENNTISNCNSYGLTIPAYAYHKLSATNTITATKGVEIDAASPMRSSATWGKQPFDVYINGRVLVHSEQGMTLTLAPGTKFFLRQGAGITVGTESWLKGSLIADGTSERIVLTLSDEERAAGMHWSNIYFGPGTMADSKLINCEISYGGKHHFTHGMIHCKSTSNTPAIKNNTISNSAGYGISTSSATPVVSGNTFSGNASTDVHAF